ncbi:MAG: pirin family protein [Planctomycetota bacterium]
MIHIRRAEDRGHVDHGWLDARHTFSFASYQDPEHTGFRDLIVINEDRVRPGTGFGTHGHQDMEILTWVLEGGLRHRDSMGSEGVIRPGEAQVMSAGKGIRHSEVNASEQESVHLLQIWILPRRLGKAPSYDSRRFDDAELRDRLCLVAGDSDKGEALPLDQDVEVRIGRLSPGTELVHELAPGRHAWLQVARGGLWLNGEELRTGDGAAVSGEDRLELRAEEAAELVLFDLR